MQYVAGQFGEQRSVARENRDVIAYEFDNFVNRGSEGEHRAHPVAGAQGALQHEGRFSKVEAVFRSLSFAQRDVGLMRIVSEPWVTELGDGDDGHAKCPDSRE